MTYNKAQKALIPLVRTSLTHTEMEGLLGNNDNKKEDDLMPKNGSVALDGNKETQRNIYYKFGETCK